jgi:hypothetical protein
MVQQRFCHAPPVDAFDRVLHHFVEQLCVGAAPARDEVPEVPQQRQGEQAGTPVGVVRFGLKISDGPPPARRPARGVGGEGRSG